MEATGITRKILTAKMASSLIRDCSSFSSGASSLFNFASTKNP
jgi:hypothetical protein